MAVLLVFVLLYQSIKIAKTRLHNSYRPIVLKDAWVLLGLWVPFLLVSNPVGVSVLLLVCALIFLWLWVDAVIFSLFQYEVNRHALSIALSGGGGGFRHERAQVFRFLLSYKWVSAIAFSWGVGFASLFLLYGLRAEGPSWVCFSLFETGVLFALTKSRLKRASEVVLWLLATGAILGLNHSIWPAMSSFLKWRGLQAPLGLFALLCCAQGLTRFVSSDFLNGKSLLLRLIFPSKGVRERAVLEEDRKVFATPAVLEKTPFHGALSSSNVLLITVESLRRDGVDFESGVFSALRASGAVSEAFYCLCPNTNAALGHLYSGAYFLRKNESHPLYLHGLKAHEKIFLSNQSAAFFGLRERLSRLGFSRIVDEPEVQSSPGRVDDRDLVRYLESRPSLLEAPWFCHVLTGQTHYPYHHRGSLSGKLSGESDYRAAACEAMAAAGALVSFVLARWPDTLVVITGDHGEALGEMGYFLHSNAAVEGEVGVPLLMHHPRWKEAGLPGVLPLGNHFDLMPTILDLLGVRHAQAVLGESLLSSSRGPRAMYFYSETQYGGYPSNSAVLLKDKKIMWDFIQEKALELEERGERVLRELSGEEREYWVSLLLQCYRHARSPESGL